MTSEIRLAIIARKSIFENIVCYDKVNSVLLDKILNSTLVQDTDEWNETNILSKIKYQTKNNLLKVIYKHTKGMSYGRVNPLNNMSLSMTRREIRHTICKWMSPSIDPSTDIKINYVEYYFDIDIENCHYVIINQICEKNGLNSEKINDYVKNREKILTMVMKEYKIDRCTAKTLFITLIYGSSLNKFFKDNNLKKDITSKTYIYLSELQKQLLDVQNVVITSNPAICYEVERNKILKGKQDYNRESSIFSTYIQEYECRILECIYLYCKSQNIIKNNECSLCSDGIMIPRKNVTDLKQLIIDLQNNVHDVTEFKINLVHKEMNEDLLDILDENQLKKVTDPNSYEFKKNEFEEKAFKIMNPILYAYQDDGELILRKKTDFVNAYENISYTKTNVTEHEIYETKKSFIEDWFKDENIRTYKKIDFLPIQNVPDGVYNTFKGFEVMKLKSNELDIKESLIYKHLFNLCGNDEVVMDYVLMLLSRKVKNPSKLTNTSIIFKSDEGCGKDIFFNWFGEQIIGKDYYFNDTDPQLIFGDFNPSMANKIICVLNELNYKEMINLVEHLKGAITTKTNRINQKSIPVYENKNHITYILLTNNDNPIKISVTDRRFTAIECNNTIANDNKYFSKLIKEIESKKYDRTFYDYLMSLESDDYDFTNNRPETEFNKDLKEHNIPVIARFLENMIYEKPDKIDDEDEFSASSIFNDFSLYLETNKIKIETSSTMFGTQLKKYTSIIKKRTNKGMRYNLNYGKLQEELIKFKYMEPIPFEPIKKMKKII